MTPGLFITFEGGEGAGKSTQLALLAERLAGRRINAIRTREPGGSTGAEALRRLLLDPPVAWMPRAETLLHFAARADHVDRLIRPALGHGTWVLCDRFTDSTMAYQGYGQGVDRGWIGRLTADLGLQPNLTLVLDVSVATTQARLAGRPGLADRYETLGAAFFASVRAGFLAIAAAAPARCVVIDGEAPVASVAERAWAAVSRLLPQ